MPDADKVPFYAWAEQAGKEAEFLASTTNDAQVRWLAVTLATLLRVMAADAAPKNTP